MKPIALASAILILMPILATVSSSSTRTYDSWADLNEDGKIDIKDISYTAKLFGTTGDPTKNVTVTNWPAPYQIQSQTLLCTFTLLSNDTEGHYYYYNYSTTPTIYVGGYTRMSIYLVPPDPNATSEYTIPDLYYNVTHTVTSIDWTDDPASPFISQETLSNTQASIIVNVEKNRDPRLIYYSQVFDNPIETKLPYLRLHILSETKLYEEPGWMEMTVKIYLRND